MAGALAGAPIRTAKCVTVDLEVPADAEIVIEGLIDSELLEPEGPFGESNGYVALEDLQHVHAGDGDHAQERRLCLSRSSAR